MIDAITQIAQYLDLDADALAALAQDAPFADSRDGGQAWLSGSGSVGERRILYAITRALKPEYMVEIGTSFGATTTQFASALKANGAGRIDTVDVNQIIFKVHPVGRFIPDSVREAVTQVIARGQEWLAQNDTPIDLLFEDADHTTETTQAIYENALKRMKPGAVLISHDTVNHFGDAVLTGIVNITGTDPLVVKVDADAVGLSFYRVPKPVTRKRATRKRKSRKTKSTNEGNAA